MRQPEGLSAVRANSGGPPLLLLLLLLLLLRLP
jgi:hypothetical protein